MTSHMQSLFPVLGLCKLFFKVPLPLSLGARVCHSVE